EAAIKKRAVPSQAIVDGRCDLRAQCVIVGEILELREIAAVAGLAPGLESAERGDGRGVARSIAQSRVEAVPAKIIAAALEQRDFHRPADDGSEQRKIAAE